MKKNIVGMVGICLLVLLFLGVSGASAWLSDYDYQTPIEIDGNIEDLTDYQVRITLQGTNSSAANYVDFDKVLTGGADIRFTDFDKITEINFWIEEWDDSPGMENAIIWVEVPSVLELGTKTIYIYYGNPNSDGTNLITFYTGIYIEGFKISSIDATAHDDYGFVYPLTYKLTIPATLANAKAYHKHSESEAWYQLTEKTTSDFFNGIECVRFDYINDIAYVSVAFDDTEHDIYIKITDMDGNSEEVNFINVCEYYDNRQSVVTFTADDWDGNSARNVAFNNACDACQLRHIWFTPGIVTAGMSDGEVPVWSQINAQLSEGYVEAAAHSKTHPHVPYGDVDGEVRGSKQDIIDNLTLPDLYKRGTKEYVWAWLEPYYEDDDAIRKKLGEEKYLVNRHGGGTVSGRGDHPGGRYFTFWDGVHGLYKKQLITSRPFYETLSKLNSDFDTCYSEGLIHHIMVHPHWISWNPTDKTCQHLDYIKNKNDVWYVGFGALYMYHYGKEGAPSIYGGSGGESTFIDFDDIEESILGIHPHFWKENETLATGTVIVSNTQVKHGSKSIRVDCDGDNYYKVNFRAINPVITENITISVWIYFSTCTTTNRFTDQGWEYEGMFSLLFDSYGKIRYSNSTAGWHNTGYNYTTGWHKFEIALNFNTKKQTIWYDSTKIVNDQDFPNVLSTSLTNLIFGSYNGSYIYADTLFIRKWTFPEPAATTTSALRGYNKIFTGVTNTISATDYVSYSTEPSVSNLVSITVSPSDIVNITTTKLSTTARIILDGIGTTNLIVQMPNTLTIYTAKYDGINCNNPNCSFTQSNGELNFSLLLGSEHTLDIEGESVATTLDKFTDITKTSIALMGILAIVVLATLIIGVLLNIQSGAEIDLKLIMIGAVGLIAFMVMMFVALSIFSVFT